MALVSSEPSAKVVGKALLQEKSMLRVFWIQRIK